MLTTASDLASTTSRISEKLNTGAMSKGEWQTYLEAAQHYEERLLAQAGSASKLIQSFKQIALDQSQPVRRDFQLNRYLHSIITSLQPTLRHTTVKVQIQCEDDLILDSYPGTFAQVMINLLLHVVQAGLAEQPTAEIHIDAQRNGQQQLLLTLRDNGLGLSPEQLKHVFEPSWQTETAQPGHVLALNVIETLVRQQLGGTLEVSSAPGKGTQFNLLLPFMAPGLHTR
ncbi:sensor histidine kinase [Paludibacterium denitrificans]|nr:HAMP domain-containing sensor histidine kinase [Paludibacterium denitrificans]